MCRYTDIHIQAPSGGSASARPGQPVMGRKNISLFPRILFRGSHSNFRECYLSENVSFFEPCDCLIITTVIMTHTERHTQKDTHRKTRTERHTQIV